MEEEGRAAEKKTRIGLQGGYYYLLSMTLWDFLIRSDGSQSLSSGSGMRLWLEVVYRVFVVYSWNPVRRVLLVVVRGVVIDKIQELWQ